MTLLLIAAASGALLALLAVGAYARLRHHRSSAPEPPEPLADEYDDPPQEDVEARLVDPDDPPWWATYRPREGSGTRCCTCHGLPIEPGDRVLMWPIKDHPERGMDVFCQRTLREAEG